MQFNSDFFYFIVRWFHYFFGVTWIGLLYYFNFVQGPFFAETDGATKSNAIQKLVPRALWWFRWGAMFTFLTGLTMLAIWGQKIGGEALNTSFGVNIMVGALLGLLMFLNVWLIIWPNQKIVIASTTGVAQGQAALPTAAGAAAKAGLASRTNTMFSIPMLFFMGAASHLPWQMSGPSKSCNALIAVAVVVLLLELNAIKGKMGPLTTVKGVIHCGFTLTAALFVILWAML